MCQRRITANFLFVVRVFCVGVRKFLIAALTGSGQMAFGYTPPPAAPFTSLLPLFVNASKVPVVAFIVVVLVLRLPFAHIKNTFSLLCHLFSHTTSVDREEGRAGTREGRGRHCKMSLS